MTIQIAAIVGTDSPQVQKLFAAAVARWQAAGARVAGVVAESHDLPDRTCAAGFLRDIASGKRFSMYLEAPPADTSCHLDAEGVDAACNAVLGALPDCDLVVLSKFGKLEAGGGGLRDAFGAAIEAGVPVLTSVSPAYVAAWEAFATPLFVVLPAAAERIDAWWRSLRSPVAAVPAGRVSAHL